VSFSPIRAVAGLAIALGLALPAFAENDTPIVVKVGVTPGPHAEIFEVVKKVAIKANLDVQIVEISDYAVPNAALDSGDLQANSFQNQPYLDDQIKARGYKLTSVARTVLFPMGVYSKKVKSLAEIKDGASFALPNDPTNEGRAIKLLAKLGFVKLRAGAPFSPTPEDIADNPKHVQLTPLNAAQIPRSLDDVDFAAINTNYAIVAGFIPSKDALGIESSTDSPYTNILVVRDQDKDSATTKALIKAYHSPEVKAFILDHFKNSVIPEW